MRGRIVSVRTPQRYTDVVPKGFILISDAARLFGFTGTHYYRAITSNKIRGRAGNGPTVVHKEDAREYAKALSQSMAARV